MHRYRLIITALTLTALTILLTVASNPDPTAQAAPRSIPWNCNDWQASPAVADADDERVSVILESLAANRGKTIYCAIDQSDTFAKAETWAAGRYRNERDDTVYFGQSGNFRGFLAAQEGYLTDGESGVTGVSRELIFEFPREQRRGWKTITKRLKVPQDNARRARTIAPTEHSHTAGSSDPRWARRIQRQHYWQQYLLNTHAIRDPNRRDAWWDQQAATAAQAYCQSRGYPTTRNIERSSRPADFVNSSSNQQLHQGWDYENLRNIGSNTWRGRAYQYVLWSATCEKKIRKRRR